MKIYTKTGDKGQTSLATGERVSKCDPRLEAYGTADELNSYIGWLRAALPIASATTAEQDANTPEQSQATFLQDIDQLLYYVQNRLFDIGAILAGAQLPLPDDCAQRLEQSIDAMQETLTPLRAFILPAGSETVSRCHICRTVTRRLERLIVNMNEVGISTQPELQIFVNRLSDFLFVLARKMGEIEKIEVSIWQK